ncbi:hypothetical protein SeLEV6574_g06855 [Synchytrium endobioticum]|uniref:Uncharacterized protein n=1 Tax=Synchytrium endobioticum TaxID=286115 RepID=A0A507CJZ6_9FUNG|nr:hypothetical protein SeLEV6574_g06855 [Synchytrium endobioticum]
MEDKQDLEKLLTKAGFEVIIAEGEADVYIEAHALAQDIIISADSDMAFYEGVQTLAMPKFTREQNRISPKVQMSHQTYVPPSKKSKKPKEKRAGYVTSTRNARTISTPNEQKKSRKNTGATLRMKHLGKTCPFETYEIGTLQTTFLKMDNSVSPMADLAQSTDPRLMKVNLVRSEKGWIVNRLFRFPKSVRRRLALLNDDDEFDADQRINILHNSILTNGFVVKISVIAKSLRNPPPNSGLVRASSPRGLVPT